MLHNSARDNAIRQASCAVVAWFYRLRGITVRADFCSYLAPVRKRPDDLACVLLAGNLAHRGVDGFERSGVCEALPFVRDAQHAQELTARTARIIASLWPSVESIADELMRTGYVGSTVLRIIMKGELRRC